MGIVFLAEDRRTHLPVAAKVMSRSLSDPELQARFMKENQILASLNHRNIVRCYEITRSREGLPTIVMEYLKGVDFGAFEGRPFPELLPLMVQASMGLAYLKERNILHRDLSPNNIFVTIQDDRRLVKILDFGVAKVLQEGSGGELTQTGEFLGKLAYASHELLTFGQIDFRSDIYSLGVIFFRLLTKRRPINVQNSRNYLEWVMAQENRAPIDFSAPEGNPPIPATLQALVAKMLAKKSDDRPQGYEEIIDALVAAQGQAEAAGLMPDPEAVSTLPSTETPKSLSGSAGSPGGPGGTPSPSGSRPGGATAVTGLFDDGAYPFTEAETKAPSSASRVGTDAMRAVASAGAPAAPAPRSAPAAPASQVPDWLEQAGYDEQIQVMSESRQGISRSPSPGVRRRVPLEIREARHRVDPHEAARGGRTEAQGRPHHAPRPVASSAAGRGPDGSSTSSRTCRPPRAERPTPLLPSPPSPPVPSRPGPGPRPRFPLRCPSRRRPVSRTARLGPEERRLVDSNVLGFFYSADRQGLNVVVSFRKPVNVSGFQTRADRRRGRRVRASRCRLSPASRPSFA